MIVEFFCLILIYGSMVKICTSNMMLLSLLSLELSTCSLFLLFNFLSPSGGEVYPSGMFLSLTVVDGVVGLIIITSMFRHQPSKGSWNLCL